MIMTPSNETGQVNNLLVSVCISSSHIGYSTGTAASILIKNNNNYNINVRDINLNQLKQTLLQQG